MDRRTILASAGALAFTLTAGAAAVATNMGLLGKTLDDGVGDLQPVVEESSNPSEALSELPVEVETIFIDVPAPSSGDAPAGQRAPQPAVEPEPATGPTSASDDDWYQDDDWYEHDDEHEDDEHEDDEHEDDEHEDDD